jgi:tRNA(Glu) U13 pseudouridine synthase TruD
VLQFALPPGAYATSLLREVSRLIRIKNNVNAEDAEILNQEQ